MPFLQKSFIPLLRSGSVALMVTLAGCGGGSDSDPAIAGLDGLWQGQPQYVYNTCSSPTGNLLSEKQQIGISGSNVTVALTNGKILTGQASSPTSFGAVYDDGLRLKYRVQYDNIHNGQATMTFDFNLDGPGGCGIRMTALMIKQ